MSCHVHKFLIPCFAFLTLLLVSCGGGGGGGGDVSNVASGTGTGTVALLVTDAPTDEFEAINLTIVEAELMSDSGRVTVFSGEKEFDLLELTDVTEVFSVSEAPEGSYNKIRLTLSQVELVFEDNRDPVYPKLPGNGKLDLNPRGSFEVDPDRPLVIQLDFDAGKSILVVEAGNSGRYNFRPVVFVDIAEGEFDTKLVRQRGTVNDIDSIDETFKFCLIGTGFQPDPGPEDELPDCILVDTRSAPASLFDDVADPAVFEDYEVGDILTVVGRFAFREEDDTNEPDDDVALLLIAEVIWRGDDIIRTDNIACSEVMEDAGRAWYQNRELPLPDGEECVDAARPTVLQPGARIYSAEGNPLPESALDEGVLNQVDGFPDTGANPDEVKAVLVMLGVGEGEEDTVQLTGTIGNIDTGESLILMTDDGDRCVEFSAAATEVFETSLDGDGNVVFSQRDVDALASGQSANSFGEVMSDGCQDARTIIYEQ